LRDLPNKLVANQIIKMTKKRVEQTLQVKDPQPLRKLFGGGLFGEFEWMPDAYDNCNQISLFNPLFSHYSSIGKQKGQRDGLEENHRKALHFGYRQLQM
jgi:hypothetical protein